MNSRTPVLNQAAIKPPTTPGSAPGPAQGPGPGPRSSEEREQAERERITRRRVAVAVEFGAALEDLVAYTHQVAHDQLRQSESGPAPRTSGLRFPPDLLVSLHPTTNLRRARQTLLKLEPKLLKEPEEEKPEGKKPEGKKPGEPNPGGPNQGPKAPLAGTKKVGPGGPNPGGSNPGGPGHGPKAPLAGTGGMKPEEKKPEEKKPGETQQAWQKSQQVWQQTQQAKQAEQEARQARQHAVEAEQRARQARQQAEKAERRQQAEQRAAEAEQKAAEAERRAREAQQRALPSKELGIEDKFTEEYIKRLLGAHGAQGENGSPDHDSPSLADLYDATCLWNDRIVERLVDYPAVLSGFRVGKALSYTQWQIEEVDDRWKREDGNPSADPWNQAFGKQRIDEIQRHVGTLSTVLDSRAVAAVSTGLDYWRGALLYLSSAEESPDVRSRPAQPSPHEEKEKSIAIPRSERVQLLKSLEEQIDYWLAVLTEQRPPESFPVPGIVASLTKKVAANAWARVFRAFLPFTFVLLIVVGLIAAGFVLFGNVSNLPTVLGGLGSVVVGVLSALFAARGQGASGGGPGAMSGGWGGPGVGMGGGWRGGASAGMGGGGAWRGGYGAGATIGNMAVSLKEDVFSDVVEQLRLEELNLAINDPLIRCVLSLKGQETGDPREDAERFLRLVYKDHSNLERLQPVFKELYKY